MTTQSLPRADKLSYMEMGRLTEGGSQSNTEVERELLTYNNHEVSKSDTQKKRRCCSARDFILGITFLGLACLSVKEILRSSAPEKLIHVSNDLPQVQAIRQFSDLNIATAEEFTVDTDLLLNKKELRWVPETGNNETFSRPSKNSSCITVTVSCRYKVLNSITYNYKDVKNIFHAVAWARGNDKEVKKKASYQWSTEQNGRQPSSLQFVIDLENGDELCVQSDRIGMIYASSLDNSFLLERI